MIPFQIKSSRIAWSCPWYRIRQDEIEDNEGHTSIYNVIDKPSSVWILPVTKNREVVLIKNYRHTVEEWCWEIPAGNQEKGIGLQETAEIELKEEVGGCAGKIEYIGEFYAAKGICNEVSHLFLATGVTLGTPEHERTEVIQTHVTSIEDALRMARTNQFQCGPSALAFFLCEERLLKLDC